MLRSVRVTRVGDTDFLVDEQVDRFRFMEENEKVMNRGGEPASMAPTAPLEALSAGEGCDARAGS